MDPLHLFTRVDVQTSTALCPMVSAPSGRIAIRRYVSRAGSCRSKRPSYSTSARWRGAILTLATSQFATWAEWHRIFTSEIRALPTFHEILERRRASRPTDAGLLRVVALRGRIHCDHVGVHRLVQNSQSSSACRGGECNKYHTATLQRPMNATSRPPH